MVGSVYRVELGDGTQLVAKIDDGPSPQLAIEGEMLRFLARHSSLPVPEVIHTASRLLLLSHLPGESRFTPGAERHAAELLAELHAVDAPQFGLGFDTLIGRLPQPNGWSSDWVPFFRDRRLRHLGRLGVEEGRLPSALFRRLDRLCEQLEERLAPPARPSLLHGDVWANNVLADGDRITGFLDPAIYFGHDEVEVAYVALFGSFGPAFFECYYALRPPAPGYQERAAIYNLYPLLSHVVHFGGHYVDSVETTLRQLGV